METKLILEALYLLLEERRKDYPEKIYNTARRKVLQDMMDEIRGYLVE